MLGHGCAQCRINTSRPFARVYKFDRAKCGGQTVSFPSLARLLRLLTEIHVGVPTPTSRRFLLRIHALRALALAALVVFWIPSALVAQGVEDDVPTVAVLDFTGLMIGQGGNSAPLGKAVSSMLITELSGRPGMRVIERFRLQDLLTEQRLSLSGRVDEDTAIEVGRLVGAQYIIHGQVTSIGAQTRMDMRAVDVETSEILEVLKATDRTTEILSLVVRMADIFAAKLELDPPSARPSMTAIPVQATIAFSRGLDSEDKGDLEEAKEQYRRALELHPEHRGAQRALDRVEGGGSQ